MRGEEQIKNEGTTKSRWNRVEVKIPLQQHKAICYSFNSRGSVTDELLCKASGTLQTVSGAGTSTPLTDGWTRQTEASACLKVLCTQHRESVVIISALYIHSLSTLLPLSLLILPSHLFLSFPSPLSPSPLSPSFTFPSLLISLSNQDLRP